MTTARFSGSVGRPCFSRASRRLRRSSRVVSRFSHSSSAFRRSASDNATPLALTGLRTKMPLRMNHEYSRRMPHSGRPPGPVRSKASFSSRTYCWSFFQLSSRRASTRSMKASRSDWAAILLGTTAASNATAIKAMRALARMVDPGVRRTPGGAGSRLRQGYGEAGPFAKASARQVP